MAKQVRIDALAAELTLAIKDYTDDVSQAIEREVESTANKVRDEIKAKSPVDTGVYKKGWSRKKTGRGQEAEHIIYNKDKPSIAHLLEFGHAKVGGVGRVDSKPHIRPAYDKLVPEMEKRIEAIIKRGG